MLSLNLSSSGVARSRPHGLRLVYPWRPLSKSNLCERALQQRGLSMILGMSVGAFTILHVIITLVAIGSGLIVVGGMFASNRLPVTTAIFLFTTALTSLTGFLFPIHGFTPALGVGIVACVILAVALFALYKENLVGRMALDLRNHRCCVALS